MFKPLFTGRLLRLAAAQPADQEAFAAWSQDEDYMRLLDDDPVRPLAPSAFGYFGESKSGDYYFHLRTLADDQLIGFVVLFNFKWSSQAAQLAIGIGRAEYRGKGYGHDALKLILNYAFSELNLNRVGLTVLSYNISAIKAYERVGFVREGALRQAVRRGGAYHDMLQYGILRAEWEAGQSAAG